MARSEWTRGVLRLLGGLVPRGERDEWLMEWDAELEHAADLPADDPRARGRTVGRLTAAAEDALRLRLRRAGRALRATPARDLRFAARTLAGSPLFTVAVVLTLALGIGVNTAFFTVVDAVLVERLPYPEPDRLVQLVWTREGRAGDAVSTPDFDDLRESARTIEHLSLRTRASLTYQGDRPIVLTGASVSAGYFRLFGTAPHLGRYFRPEDDARGATPSVVLSHGAWQRLFGGDPGLVGETLTLEQLSGGRAHVVVGVAEPGLRDPVADVDAWTSRPAWIELEKRGQGWLQVFGRIAPHATFEHATAELRALSESLARDHPVSNADRTFAVASLQQQVVQPIRPALVVLLAAVGLVLLISCANVANLILVRSVGRERELAVRISLGAGRGRLAGQLLVEGLLLAALGGAAGLALAFGATRGLVALGAPGVPRLADLQVDGRVLLFTLLLSSLTGVVFGLVPLVQLSGVDPSRTLREAGRSGEGRRARRVRRALVAAELAIATVLLVGAGLLVRSLSRITQVDTGLRTEGVLTFEVAPPQDAFATPAHLRAFYDRLQGSLSRLPGVEAVGGVNMLPLMSFGSWYSFVREDAPPPAPGESPLAELRVVEPGYFRSVGIPLLSGRLLDEGDAADAPPTLLVDEVMAREHFPGEDPVGKRITLPWGAGVAPVSCEVVGVVGEVRLQGPTSEAEPTLYLLRGHDTTPHWLNRVVSITVRTSGDPMALAEAARQAVWEVERTVPVTGMKALDQYLREHRSGTRNQVLLIGLFALLATVLASVGIFGVVAYAVARRGHEIGVRQALGADTGDVVRLVLGEGVRLIALGLPTGLLLAAAASRMLRTLLFGVEPGDPLTYAAVGLGLAAVALTAAWIPARRAAGVHPAAALRGDA